MAQWQHFVAGRVRPAVAVPIPAGVAGAKPVTARVPSVAGVPGAGVPAAGVPAARVAGAVPTTAVVGAATARTGSTATATATAAGAGAGAGAATASAARARSGPRTRASACTGPPCPCACACACAHPSYRYRRRRQGRRLQWPTKPEWSSWWSSVLWASLSWSSSLLWSSVDVPLPPAAGTVEPDPTTVRVAVGGEPPLCVGLPATRALGRWRRCVPAGDLRCTSGLIAGSGRARCPQTPGVYHRQDWERRRRRGPEVRSGWAPRVRGEKGLADRARADTQPRHDRQRGGRDSA